MTWNLNGHVFWDLVIKCHWYLMHVLVVVEASSALNRRRWLAEGRKLCGTKDTGSNAMAAMLLCQNPQQSQPPNDCMTFRKFWQNLLFMWKSVAAVPCHVDSDSPRINMVYIWERVMFGNAGYSVSGCTSFTLSGAGGTDLSDLASREHRNMTMNWINRMKLDFLPRSKILHVLQFSCSLLFY